MNTSFRTFLEEVRTKTDILTLFTKYGVQVSHSNMAKCPFHEDKTGSLSIKPEWGYWRCFGCSASGDVFEFTQRIESISFSEAVQKLATEAGVPIPERREDFQHFEEERSIDDVLTETAHFYTQNLTPEARDYLQQRGFSAQILEEYRIGFAKGGLVKHLIEKGFTKELCLKSGVIYESEGSLHDSFVSRIIFPTIKRGRVVYLIGRSLGDEQPKYRNLKREIKYLYNEEALTQKGVFLVEGIPDCLSAIAHGYQAVALLGTNLRHEHIQKFSRCERIYLCFDGDEAGRKANHEVGKLLGDKARIILLPDNTDLDEFLKDRQEQFNELIKTAKDIVTYKIELIPEDISKIELANSLKPILQILSEIDVSIAEAFLILIKKRFKLNTKELDGYRKKVKDIKEAVQEKEPTTGDITKQKMIAYFDNLVDLVEVDDKPLFLIKDKGEFKIVTEVILDGETYYPPPKDQIPWMLPSGNEVMSILDGAKDRDIKELDKELYDDICSHHKLISELSNELYYDMLAAWVMHTYLMEQFQYTPYLCLFAAPEMGKTRTGKGIIYIAYRGLHIESLRDADLIRVTDRFKGTVFFDVMDIWSKAEKMGSEDVLLQRFERGAVVRRVNNPERGPFRDTDTYRIFGPTIIGTNTGTHRILETRSITISMPKSDKIFAVDVTPAFAISLKERLVAFRARHMNDVVEQVDKPSPDRLGDIIRPLLQIIKLVRPEKEEDFMVLLEIIQKERKTEKSETLEAELVKVISGLENRVEFGFLATELITAGINEGKDEKHKLAPRYLGRILKALGFDKERVGSVRGIKWDIKHVERLKKAYDV